MIRLHVLAFGAIIATVIFNATITYFFYIPLVITTGQQQHGVIAQQHPSQSVESRRRDEEVSKDPMSEYSVQPDRTETSAPTLKPTKNVAPDELNGSNEGKKRFGICVTGQYARLELKSKVENFMKPLLETYYDEIDVVLLLATGPPKFANAKFAGGGVSPHDSRRKIQNILSEVATSVRFIDYDQPPNPRVLPEYLRQLDKGSEMSDSAQELRAKIHLRQWFGYIKCYHALTDLELKHGTQYEAVARIREDGYIAKPIVAQAIVDELAKPRRLLSIRCENWRGINDKLGIVRRQHAEDYFMIPIMEYYMYPDQTLSTTKDLKNPERYLKFAYYRHKFTHKKLTSDIITVLAHRWTNDGNSCLKTVASTHFDCHSHGDLKLFEQLMEMRCGE